MRKSFEHFRHLDEDEYWEEICELGEDELRQQHALMGRKLLGASASTGASVGGAVLTGGLSLIVTPISARRMNVNARRKALIEKRLKEQGWALYKFTKRDYAIPLAATIVGGAVIPGAADAVVGHISTHVATNVAAQHVSTHVATNVAAQHTTTAASHQGTEAARAVLTHPAVFVHAAEQSASTQVSDLTGGAIGHAAVQAAQFTPITDFATNQAAVLGATAGHGLAVTMEKESCERAAKWATSHGMRKGFEAMDERRDMKLPALNVVNVPLSTDSSPSSSSPDRDRDDQLSGFFSDTTSRSYEETQTPLSGEDHEERSRLWPDLEYPWPRDQASVPTAILPCLGASPIQENTIFPAVISPSSSTGSESSAPRETLIEHLCAWGFPREYAANALIAASDDIEKALDYLFEASQRAPLAGAFNAET
jgi:hypothetical protein